MTETGDMWREYREYQRNMGELSLNKSLPKAMKILKGNGASVEVKNNGHHWVVGMHDVTVDYWPTNSKTWICRACKKDGSMARHLILHLNSAHRPDA